MKTLSCLCENFREFLFRLKLLHHYNQKETRVDLIKTDNLNIKVNFFVAVQVCVMCSVVDVSEDLYM